MVNRRYLRTKVMQAIFAYKANSRETISAGEKKLTNAIESCYELFCYFFFLFLELKDYRWNKMEDIKRKVNPSYEDLHPNTKFVDNKLIQQIENNITLKKLFTKYKINWTNGPDIIVKTFQEIRQLEEYLIYMNNEERNYKEDKKLILTIIEKVFANNQLLSWFLGEKNIHWIADYNSVLFLLYKNICLFKEKNGYDVNISPLYINEVDDVIFYKELYRKTILHDKEYFDLIESILQNWEAERVMDVDMILMKMAICEFVEFPTIPVKVTINEYIEIAKAYSSAKSGYFINGILDNALKLLKEQGKLNKTGLGLIN